jgi:hypothetical protein
VSPRKDGTAHNLLPLGEHESGFLAVQPFFVHP